LHGEAGGAGVLARPLTSWHFFTPKNFAGKRPKEQTKQRGCPTINPSGTAIAGVTKQNYYKPFWGARGNSLLSDFNMQSNENEIDVWNFLERLHVIDVGVFRYFCGKVFSSATLIAA